MSQGGGVAAGAEKSTASLFGAGILYNARQGAVPVLDPGRCTCVEEVGLLSKARMRDKKLLRDGGIIIPDVFPFYRVSQFGNSNT